MVFGKIVTVDFGKKGGRMKSLAGLNVGPVFSACGNRYDVSADFAEMLVPAVRLCDIESPYGKNQFVDIHCLFPDFSADETQPESYNFAETDKYLSAIRAAGAEIVFRLGESRDTYERKLYVNPPRDVMKWARVCEHVVAHYNEGFAGGYKWNVKYWEIWNLPEDEEHWTGDAEQFFELYSSVSQHLKERFPKIKLGGYGSLGFSSLNRIDTDVAHKRAPEYAERFFAYLKAKKAPLDFFSWYSYVDSPEEIALHARYARNALDGVGFKRTQSFVCGFNIMKEGGKAYDGCSADLTATFITAQKSCIDMMFYSDVAPFAELNGLYRTDGDGVIFTAAKSAFYAFGRLYSLKNTVEALGDSRRELYSLAARNSSSGAILIAVREYSGSLEIRLKNADFAAFSVKRLYEEGGEARSRVKSDIALGGNKIVLSVERNDVYLLEFTK